MYAWCGNGSSGYRRAILNDPFICLWNFPIHCITIENSLWNFPLYNRILFNWIRSDGMVAYMGSSVRIYFGWADLMVDLSKSKLNMKIHPRRRECGGPIAPKKKRENFYSNWSIVVRSHAFSWLALRSGKSACDGSANAISASGIILFSLTFCAANWCDCISICYNITHGKVESSSSSSFRMVDEYGVQYAPPQLVGTHTHNIYKVRSLKYVTC